MLVDPEGGQVLGERVMSAPGSTVYDPGHVVSESLVTRELVDAVPADLTASAVRLTCHVDEEESSISCEG